MQSVDIPPGLRRWHEWVQRTRSGHGAEGLPAMIATDAVFRSPAVFAPQRGRELVAAYLGAALQVLGNEHFHYERQWQRDNGAVLEFVTELDGKQVHGVDMIEWDASDLISDFTVMIRPVSALTVVMEHMAAALPAG